MPLIPRCEAGRAVGHDCKGDPIHVIGAHDGDDGRFVELRLCDAHFAAALAKGLITDPYISGEVFDEHKRRMPPGNIKDYT